MRIMYVEDNPANISLLQRIARMGGHDVINYTDGEVALSKFAADHPDLVLMDLQLEGRIGGLEVVRKLREEGFKTPIIAVTAYAMVGDRERCLAAGCDGYLSKPLPVGELVELVQQYELGFKAKAVVTPATITETVEVKPSAVSDMSLDKPSAVSEMSLDKPSAVTDISLDKPPVVSEMSLDKPREKAQST